MGLALVSGLEANAATRYVAGTGIDRAGCGTITSPCKTISYTIENVAANGDIVIVSKGVYSEGVNVNRELTITGSGTSSTIIDGGGRTTTVTVSSPATISNLTIQHGYTFSCGGGLLNNNNLTLSKVSVTGNSAQGGDIGSGLGAGICNQGSLTLLESTVSNNSAEEAAGIMNYAGVVLYRSTVSGNSTDSFGGGIESFGPVYAINSTISNNNAIFGGGFEMHNYVYLYNATISGNSAQIGGGIDQEPAGPSSLYLQNTILAGNTDSYSNPDCNAGSVTSGDYNLIGNTAGCNVALAPHDLTNVLADLGPLQLNGGPTETEVPQPGSPAIDGANPAGCTGPKGLALDVDQRGYPRNSPPCDIGAVEVQSR